MTITLPDEMRAEVEAKAKASRLPVDQYIASLVIADDVDDGTVIDDQPGRAENSPRNRAELERMLDQGMADQPVVVADAAFWAERRRVLRERMAAKGRGEPA